MSSTDTDDLNVMALRAERELNSHAAKTGHVAPGHEGVGASDSTTESGVNADVEHRFPGARVTYGSAASGAGDNRDITEEEGGGLDRETGRQTKARDFEGEGGPEDKRALRERERGGDQEVQGNVRQR